VGTPSVSPALHRQPAAWTMTLRYCSFSIFIFYLFFSVSLDFDIVIYGYLSTLKTLIFMVTEKKIVYIVQKIL